jgi:hypothetical protein
MQFPHENAAPFEFARPVLLLAAVAFSVGFGGYLAVTPHSASPAAAHDSAAPTQSLTPSTAAVVSAPRPDLAARASKT